VCEPSDCQISQTKPASCSNDRATTRQESYKRLLIKEWAVLATFLLTPFGHIRAER